MLPLIVFPIWIFIFLCLTAYNFCFPRKHLLRSSHTHSPGLRSSLEIHRRGPIAHAPSLHPGAQGVGKVLPPSDADASAVCCPNEGLWLGLWEQRAEHITLDFRAVSSY